MAALKTEVALSRFTQNICVAVPVDFGASATVGEAFVECLGASASDICTECNIAPADVNPLETVKA